MPSLAVFRGSLAGELFVPGSPGYEAIRRGTGATYRAASPRFVVLCRSVADVVAALDYATAIGERVVPRGGGHSLAGRSWSEGIVLDLSGLDSISVTDDGVATIGGGARLGPVYEALQAEGRTLPAGCGATVGIAGLTLGGGIGLLGRTHGLTCDRLVGAQVALADGRVVWSDASREPDLFWALGGAGGGQFGVVTSLRFNTVTEPAVTRIEAHWSAIDLERLASTWQAWAPDAPDGLTANLSLESEPGHLDQAILFGASTLGENATSDLLNEFTDEARITRAIELRPNVLYHQLKDTFNDRDTRTPEHPRRIRSEFFACPMRRRTLMTLLARLCEPRAAGRRQLHFTAMAGMYNRVAEDATAFAHRSERFLLEHVADAGDPWVNASWTIAHADASGRVYPNFPDPALDDWPTAYHGGNYRRLVAIKHDYDPRRLFDFPQAI